MWLARVRVSVAALEPLTIHESSGSAVMMGKTANNKLAPKNDKAPDRRLPVYGNNS